jgi:hypothetical protein
MVLNNQLRNLYIFPSFLFLLIIFVNKVNTTVVSWNQETPSGGDPTLQRCLHKSLVHGKHMIVYGGKSGSTRYGDLWKLDLINSQWESITPTNAAPTARDSASAVNHAFGTGIVNVSNIMSLHSSTSVGVKTLKFCMDKTYSTLSQDTTDGSGTGANVNIFLTSDNSSDSNIRRFYLSETGSMCPDGHNIKDPAICEAAKNDFISRIGDCSDPQFYDQQVNCELPGTCGATSGVGNGAAHNNNKGTCESSSDCGEATSKLQCVWTANNTWTVSGTCSDGSSSTESDCVQYGTCTGNDGSVGNGATHNDDEASCIGAADCGASSTAQCYWTATYTWTDTSACSDTSHDIEALCIRFGSCAAANGEVGNGANYADDEAACVAATDCGNPTSAEQCVWTAANIWTPNAVSEDFFAEETISDDHPFCYYHPGQSGTSRSFLFNSNKSNPIVNSNYTSVCQYCNSVQVKISITNSGSGYKYGDLVTINDITSSDGDSRSEIPITFNVKNGAAQHTTSWGVSGTCDDNTKLTEADCTGASGTWTKIHYSTIEGHYYNVKEKELATGTFNSYALMGTGQCADVNDKVPYYAWKNSAFSSATLQNGCEQLCNSFPGCIAYHLIISADCCAYYGSGFGPGYNPGGTLSGFVGYQASPSSGSAGEITKANGNGDYQCYKRIKKIGHGSGATFDIHINNNGLTSIFFKKMGSGYAVNDDITIDGNQFKKLGRELDSSDLTFKVPASYTETLVVFGGYDGSTRLNDLQTYNYATNAWEEIIADGGSPPNPTKRFGHSAVVYDDSMYIFGGYATTTVMNDLHRYRLIPGPMKRPSLNKWTPRNYASVFYGGRSGGCTSATMCKLECDSMFASSGDDCSNDCTGMCYCGCPGSGGWSDAVTLNSCYDYCVVAYVNQSPFFALTDFPSPSNPTGVTMTSPMDTICQVHSGADIEYTLEYLELHYKDLPVKYVNPANTIEWSVDTINKRSGLCNMMDYLKCEEVCKEVEGCNFFSRAANAPPYCCYIHKTCENEAAETGYDIYSMNLPDADTILIESVGWEAIAFTAGSGPEAREQHTAFIDSTRMYILAGYDYNTNALGNVWMFDLITKEWTNIGENAMDPTIVSKAIAMYGNDIFYFGPSGNELISLSISISSSLKKALIIKNNDGSSPPSRKFSSMVVYKNSLFLFGGRNPNDSTNHYNDVWKANFVNVCDFKSNGKVHLTADCTLHNEILVTDKLEIYGTEISPGVLPKIISEGSNRLFKIDSDGQFIAKNVEFKDGNGIGTRVIGRCLSNHAGFENIGACDPDTGAEQSVTVPDATLDTASSENIKALKFELDNHILPTTHSLVVHFDMKVVKMSEVDLGYSFIGMGRCDDEYDVDTTSNTYYTANDCYEYCLAASNCNGFSWKETTGGGECARSLTNCPVMTQATTMSITNIHTYKVEVSKWKRYSIMVKPSKTVHSKCFQKKNFNWKI